MMAPADPLQPPQDLPFQVDVTWAPDGTACLLVRGELDWASVPELRDALDRAVREGGAAVDVDASRLRFCDAVGLGVLVEAHRRLDEQGRALRVLHAGSRFRRLLTLGGVDYLLGPSAARD